MERGESVEEREVSRFLEKFGGVVFIYIYGCIYTRTRMYIRFKYIYIRNMYIYMDLDGFLTFRHTVHARRRFGRGQQSGP